GACRRPRRCTSPGPAPPRSGPGSSPGPGTGRSGRSPPTAVRRGPAPPGSSHEPPRDRLSPPEEALQGGVNLLLGADLDAGETGILEPFKGGHQGALPVIPGTGDLAVAHRAGPLQKLAHQLHAADVVRREVVTVGEVEGVDVVFRGRKALVDDLQGLLVRGGALGAARLALGEELLLRHLPGPGVVGDEDDLDIPVAGPEKADHP